MDRICHQKEKTLLGAGRMTGTRKMLQLNEQKADVVVFIEYKQLCRAVAIGFGVMGVIGYLVKLIHIPM